MEWFANCHPPPWAAIRALRAGRLIGFDKKPGVRPLGIGEAFYRLLAKVVVHLEGKKASEACGISNVAAGISSGIEGLIHALREPRDAAYPEADPPLPPPPQPVVPVVAPRVLRRSRWGPRLTATPPPVVTAFLPALSRSQKRRGRKKRREAAVAAAAAGGTAANDGAAAAVAIVQEIAAGLPLPPPRQPNTTRSVSFATRTAVRGYFPLQAANGTEGEARLALDDCLGPLAAPQGRPWVPS